MSRKHTLAVAFAAMVLMGTAACSGDEPGSAAATEAGETPAATTPAATTSAAVTTSAAPAEPVVGPGPCPYLDENYIEEAVGDRMDRVETVTVEGQPAPDCVFYLLNGSVGVTVDLTPYADPVAAQNAALALVTTAAQPITDIGDYGGVLVAPGTTVLAVTTGALLMAVTINKESSLEAREIATTALAALPAA